MEQGSISNRRSRRANVLLAAIIESAGRDFPVRLRNLSAHGALIQADKLPAEGEAILFRRNDIIMPGRIAWVIGLHAGVEFDRMLDPDVVLRNVPSLKPRAKPNFRRPGVTTTSLSREEEQFIQRWLREP